MLYSTLNYMSELPSSISDLESIRANQRFSTFSAKYKQEKVFIKQLHNANLKKALRAEVWGIETFTQLAKVKKFPFNIPNVVLSGENFLVTTWVDGEPMQLNHSANSFNNDIEFLASSYAAIDQVMTLANPMQTSWVHHSNGSTVLDHLLKRLQPLAYRDFFSEDLIKNAIEYIHRNLPILEARLTHADFTPNNIMVDDDQKTLIDFESVNLLWPRFYDVVNMTINKQLLEPDLTVGMKQLFDSFSQKTEFNINTHLHQVNTIAMVRALSLIIECLGQPDTLHNTEYSMTPEIAARLQQVMGQVFDEQLYILNR